MITRSQLARTAAAALLALAIVARADAAPIVSFNPASQDATIGDTVSVDIVVSGLTEALGGFSLFLNFNDNVLAGTGVSFNSTAFPGGCFSLLSPCFSFGGGGSGPLDIYFVAEDDPGTLTTAQTPLLPAFTLATITFDAIDNGLSQLRLADVVLSDVDGFEIDGVQTVIGRVCVGGNCNNNVPEPGLLALFGAGLSALVVRRRARR